MKIIFFGTQTFATTILEALLAEPLFEVSAVITQPDRPAGRSQQPQKSPVKLLAEKHGFKIEQPQSLKNYTLDANRYTLGITAQYGGLIPKHILEAPKYGILNIHTSLLPKYRGASPIQSAIMNGETETGVTIMKMDEGLDTGPILLQKKLALGPDDTYPEVEMKLAKLGAAALLEAVPKYLGNELKPVPQDEAQATHCRQLTRDDGQIDWQGPAREIYNQYRGLTPWPGVWTMWGEKRLKMLRLSPPHARGSTPTESGGGGGKVIVEHDRLYLTTRDQLIEIIELQLEGKKPMTGQIFLLGHKEFATSTLV